MRSVEKEIQGITSPAARFVQQRLVIAMRQ
jgi:hypothetical protein